MSRVQYQKGLVGHDKLRGHGRPVLSEQQGTTGLAGLSLLCAVAGRALHR